MATRDGRGGSAICKPILLLLTELTLFRLAPRRKTLKKTGKEGMHLGGSQARLHQPRSPASDCYCRTTEGGGAQPVDFRATTARRRGARAP